MKPKIQILSNTNFSLSDVLKSELSESIDVKFAVAFLRRTGLAHIYKMLDYALTINKAKIEIIVGLDFKTTDTDALFALDELKNKYENFNFYCFGDKRDNYNDLVFHPKIYMFNTELSKETKFTSIIGSSNLTGGGITSNFEVNTIFREDKPQYYNQLSSIYNEIKFTDSIFSPSKNYIRKYGNIKEEVDKSDKKIEKEVQQEIVELRKEEILLPGTVPTLKRLIIDFIKLKNKEGLKEIPVEMLYIEIEKLAIERKVKIRNMDTFRNTLRGELNKHEQNSEHPQNMKLFIREGRGLYSLTKIGENYEGR